MHFIFDAGDNYLILLFTKNLHWNKLPKINDVYSWSKILRIYLIKYLKKTKVFSYPQCSIFLIFFSFNTYEKKKNFQWDLKIVYIQGIFSLFFQL